VEYTCIAADLLQQMFSELQALAATHSRLARAMAGSERYALCVKDHSTAISLKRNATVLKRWLSDELHELSLSVDDGE
jgi:hypothetical protein